MSAVSDFIMGLGGTRIPAGTIQLVETYGDAASRDEYWEAARVEAELLAILNSALDVAHAAVAAHKQEDFVTSVRLYKQVADTVGNELGARCCKLVGQAYMDGSGVAEDHDEALRYFAGAVAGGEKQAHAGIGRIYLERAAGQSEYELALFHLREGASAGSGDAHADLAEAYLNGRGVAKDPAIAVEHATAAANGESVAGRARGMFMLAIAHEFGQGVRRDYRKAAQLLRKFAAETGVDVSTELRELEEKRQASRPRVPVISTLLFLVVAAAIGLGWGSISNWQRLAGGLGLAATALWPLLVIASNTGEEAQRRIRDAFIRALADQPRNIRIGGVRWIITDGEFRRLDYDSGRRGQLPREWLPRGQRRARELASEKQRRTTMPMLAALAALFAVSQFGGRMVPWTCLGAATCLLVGAWLVIEEYLYRHGYQMIMAPMVLDPPPSRIGQEDVENQKVHGEARLATAQEAIAAAARRKGGSSIHDMKF